jgi:hypothetical protein
MSTTRIKGWGRNSGGFLPLGKCSNPNCDKPGEEFDNGQLYCARDLSLTLSRKAPAIQNVRPGQRIGR